VARERSDDARKPKPSPGADWTLAEKPSNAASRNIRQAVTRLKSWLRDLPNVKVDASAAHAIIANGGQWDAAHLPIAYDPDTRTIEINERCRFWNQPRKYMRRFYTNNKRFCSPNPGHLEAHEVAHSKHHHFAEATYNALRTRGGIWPSRQQHELASYLSKRAAGSPLEFVAEFYAARLLKSEVSADRLADFERMYRAFEGPSWE